MMVLKVNHRLMQRLNECDSHVIYIKILLMYIIFKDKLLFNAKDDIVNIDGCHVGRNIYIREITLVLFCIFLL